MNFTHIHFESDIHPAQHFRKGVSLHSHTLHSKESLEFIYKFARSILPLRIALDGGAARYERLHGTSLDLRRGHWTPPLSARQAWTVEVNQIENRLDMESLVSLSDHDSIEAPMSLQLLDACRVPVSVEWTVPFGGTFFHIGVHNLPGETARQTMATLAAFTEDASAVNLNDIFRHLSADPQVLIVFNHPNWDEKGIGEEVHRDTARRFAALFKSHLHAFELNGLRPWTENRTVFELAKMFEKPLISGGDRHATEPNTLLNLSNAATFSEFVEEVRNGVSDIFITDQYREPLSMRILHSLEDILGYREDHVYDWKTWSDRAFYLCDDGVTRSLRDQWGEEPLAVRLFTKGVDLLRNPQFRQAFRLAFAKREEVVL
ncbi:MAG: hypothetical protein ABL995_08750 [Bryobacteraceae bacterium]